MLEIKEQKTKKRYQKVPVINGQSIPTLNDDHITLQDLIAVKKFRLKNHTEFNYGNLLPLNNAPELLNNRIELLRKLGEEAAQLKNALVQLESQVKEALLMLSFCMMNDFDNDVDILTQYSDACQKIYASTLNQIKFYPVDALLKFNLKSLYEKAYIVQLEYSVEDQLLESIEKNTEFLRNELDAILLKLQTLAEEGNQEAHDKLKLFAKLIKNDASPHESIKLWLNKIEEPWTFKEVKVDDQMDEFFMLSPPTESDDEEEQQKDSESSVELPAEEAWKTQISRQDLIDLSRAARNYRADETDANSLMENQPTYDPRLFMRDFRRALNSNNAVNSYSAVEPSRKPESPKPTKRSDDQSSSEEDLSFVNEDYDSKDLSEDDSLSSHNNY